MVLSAITEAIGKFLSSARQPVLIEPGEDPMEIRPERLVLGTRGSTCTLECWDDRRNLVRRIRAIGKARRGFLEMEVEHFGRQTGAIFLVDQAAASNAPMARRGTRQKYREQFRMSLRRQYSGWKLVELSTEPDLHHSLSPAYPRALLRRGSQGVAAIGAAEDSQDPDGALSFGLIWLDYLRNRERRLAIGTLALFLPIGSESTTCHRVRYLNPRAAQCQVFVHGNGILEELVDPRDYTNLSTRLDPFRASPGDLELTAWLDRLAAIPEVERCPRPDGSVTLAVRGLEFARSSGAALLFGVDARHAAGERQLPEIESLARGLARLRSPTAADRANPLYLRHPEAWLESQIRRSPSVLDASLRDAPLYSQAPQFAAGSRSILDLLGVDHSGRLVILEVKASQDIHLPLQALDYWMRVQWHLERGEFTQSGYFPGIPLVAAPPRLLLVAPALEYHPSNEKVLQYFSLDVPVERIGIGIQWRQELRVMFRTPATDSQTWPSQSSGRFDKQS